MEKEITLKQQRIVVAIIILVVILFILPSIPKRWYITDKIYLEPGNLFLWDYSYCKGDLPIYRYSVDEKNDIVFMESRYEPFYLILHMDGSTIYEVNELDSLPKDIQDIFNDESKFVVVKDGDRNHVHFD